jgi:Amino acid permease
VSAFGNVLAVTFANSRGISIPLSILIDFTNSTSVKQELGKEGVLPWSRFWASDKPYGTPAAALALHWLFSVIMVSSPKSDDAYKLFIYIFTYTQTLIGRAFSLPFL